MTHEGAVRVTINGELYDVASAISVAQRNGIELFIRDEGGAFMVSTIKVDFYRESTESKAIMPISPEHVLEWAKANGAVPELTKALRSRIPFLKG